MRRSAAPSFKADIKRARFLPQIMKDILIIDKENSSGSAVNNSVNTPVINTKDGNHESPEKIRSNKDVLDIIFEADSTVSEIKDASSHISLPEEKLILDTTEKIIQPQLNTKPIQINNPNVSSFCNANDDASGKISNCIFCVKDMDEATLFNVVWCKRSGKKHKTWEGDGFLIVRSRSAVLKDLNGKILDKGVGYKLKETESLEEGSKFFIGGKECEIQCMISDEECQSSKYCKCNSRASTTTHSPVKKPQRQVSVSIHKPC